MMKKQIFIRLDQPKVMKSLHKQADSRPRRAYHLRQLNHDPGSFRYQQALGIWLARRRCSCPFAVSEIRELCDDDSAVPETKYPGAIATSYGEDPWRGRSSHSPYSARR